MFIKLFTQILDSSIADNRRLRHFFTDLLLCADCKGYIVMTTSAIARRVGCSVDEAEWGIAELVKPDPLSKTPDSNGARIEVLEGQGYGWRIINYENYRAMRDADQLREATKLRVRRHREKKAKEDDVTHVTHDVTHGNAITEAEAEAETEAEVTHTLHESPKLNAVQKYAKSAPVPIADDCAIAFFDTMEASGWVNRHGQPIADWRAALRRYASAWNENLKSRNHKNGTAHRQEKANKEYKEPSLPLPRI